MKLRFVAPLLVAVTACDRPAPPPDGGVASAPAPSASAAPEPPLVDLLYRTHAKVAVSSVVANVKDYPEHLIDKRPETAWNGKTGDLTAHVDFRVPAATRVKRILITPGYDKVGKDGDLFTMNHRLKQVAVDREGQRIGVFSLNPEDRKPQSIEIDQAGGTFTITPVETMPGTKAKWREIVISELVVLGTAPDEELLAPAMPPVAIGTLDAAKAAKGAYAELRAQAPFPTLEAYCAREKAVSDKDLAARKAKDPNDPFLEDVTSRCAPVKVETKDIKLGEPFSDVQLISAIEGEDQVARIAVKTSAGWFPTEVIISSFSPGPGCGLFSNDAIESIGMHEPRTLIMTIDKHTAYCMAGAPAEEEAAASFLVACHADQSGKATCSEELIASYDGDCAIAGPVRAGEAKFEAKPPYWDWTRATTIDDDGTIRLMPCTNNKGEKVGCNKRNADLLRRSQ